MLPSSLRLDHRRRRLVSTATAAVALLATCALGYRTLGADLVSAGPLNGQSPEVTVTPEPVVVTIHPAKYLPMPSSQVLPAAAPTAAGGLAPSSAATPATPGAATAPAFAAFANATTLYTASSFRGYDEPAESFVVLSRSAAAAASGSAVPLTDELRQPTFTGPLLGTTAYGTASSLDGEYLEIVSTGAPGAQAWSPGAQILDQHNLVDTYSEYPFLVRSGGGNSAANTTTETPCVYGEPLSQGHSELGRIDLLTANEYYPTPVLPILVGASSTDSTTQLKGRGAKAVAASTSTLHLPKVTFLAGTPMKVSLDFLQPVTMTAAAGGRAGTAAVTYSVPDPTAPAFAVTSSKGRQTYAWSGKGVPIHLGPVHVTVGTPAVAHTKADGTQSAGSADLVTGRLSGLIDAIETLPLGAGYYPAIQPEFKLGHLEARASVPRGGTGCP